MPIATTIPARLAVLAMAITCRPAVAQQLRLTDPDATLQEEFSAIRGIRPLADGRLLVSDYIDQRVVLIDLDRQTVRQIVTVGGGPKEARLPTRLIAMRGDSTLLVDLGNNRLLLLDDHGRAVRTIPAEHPGVLGVHGMDATGALYFAVPAWAEQEAPLPGDSVRILRWQPRSGASELVAVIQGDRMRSDIRTPALTPRIPTVGHAAQDGWVVSDSGVVRIVRAGSYQVESRGPGNRVVVGPSYAYVTRAVNAADRLAYVREFMAMSPMSGKGPNGGMGYSPTLSEKELAAQVRGTEFAERLPMFSAGEVIAAPAGRLWVGRPAREGEPVSYDVFDAGGRRIATVEIRPGRKVMAVGPRGVYVVVESEAGIQRLERYAPPM
jgi:hypothetical protein